MKPIWLWIALLLSVGVNLGVLATIGTHRLRQPARWDRGPRESRSRISGSEDDSNGHPQAVFADENKINRGHDVLPGLDIGNSLFNCIQTCLFSFVNYV